MRTLYIECNMGAAGDMLAAALAELLPDRAAFIEAMNAAGIPGLHMELAEKMSCGIRGSHLCVKLHGAEEHSHDVPAHEHVGDEQHAHDHHAHAHHTHDDAFHTDGHHHHRGMEEIREIVAGLKLPSAVRENAQRVYELIARAEAQAHGCEMTEVHFHEVGMLDAIADVCAVCLLMELLHPERVVVSPICTGYGEVRCMHGIVPVPAPATAWLLQGMPAYAGHIRGELLTPTGAALLKFFADAFEEMPPMVVRATGYGMGTKEFEAANCVRAFLGDSLEDDGDKIEEISCNLDDMRGEAIAFACEKLMQEGALDVYLTPIQMKKGRPGTKLSCICRPNDAQRMSELMLLHTTTLGVRMQPMSRRVLPREQLCVSTQYGEIRVKRAQLGGRLREKPEYEDVARAAQRHDVPLSAVMAAAERALEELNG